jgi:hypothetical protein
MSRKQEKGVPERKRTDVSTRARHVEYFFNRLANFHLLTNEPSIKFEKNFVPLSPIFDQWSAGQGIDAASD